MSKDALQKDTLFQLPLLAFSPLLKGTQNFLNFSQIILFILNNQQLQMRSPSLTIVLLCLLQSVLCNQNLTTQQAWIYGSLVGIGISLMGFVAALFLVCIRSLISPQSFMIFVNMLYSLGCGAIIGDAIIHILPDAYKDQTANSQIVSFIFICAVVFFLIIERLFEAFGISHHHWGDQKHEHSHSHHDQRLQNHDQHKQIEKVETHHHSHSIKQDEDHSKEHQISCMQGLKGKEAAGYLNLISSFIHNFFDGFAIGVGFASRDPHVYIPIMIAIIAHEIPREMGDVGILMKSGFTSIQTVLCNGIINFMSLAGLFPGLALGGISKSSQNYIMTFVAGNFIYVGADIWRNLLRNKSLLQNVMELTMFFLGVGAMFLVKFLEHDHE